MPRESNPISKVTVPHNPPPGTRSFERDGTRYDLMPHRNGQDTLLMEYAAAEPHRIQSSWISTGLGVEAFMRNWGHRAAVLPAGTPLDERLLPHAQARLAQERKPIDLDDFRAPSGPR